MQIFIIKEKTYKTHDFAMEFSCKFNICRLVLKIDILRLICYLE